MYLVLDKKIKVNEEHSFTTYQKRFFNDTIEKLSTGASAHKNYVLGDTLYFYNVKDSLDIKNLYNGEQLFKFKVFEEIPYMDIIKDNKNSYLRIFKFAENIESISTSNRIDAFLDDLLGSFSFLDLIDLYSFMLNKNKELKKGKLDYLISRYELGMIDKSYDDEYSATLAFYKLLNKDSINKSKLVDRFKSIVINERCLSQKYMTFLDDILHIEDPKMSLGLLEVWLKNSITIISLEQDIDVIEIISDVISNTEKDLTKILSQYNDTNKDDVIYIKSLINEIKSMCSKSKTCK